MKTGSRAEIAYELGRTYRRNNIQGNPYHFEFSTDIEELSKEFERGYFEQWQDLAAEVS